MKKTPKPIRAYTGDQEKVSKTIDDFFSETRKFIEAHYVVSPPYWEIKSGTISYGQRPSNDRITYLKYQDIIFAQVLETRTEFNNIRYTFSRHIKKGVKKLF